LGLTVVIVDSTVWIDFLAPRANPETSWMRGGRARNSIALLDVILCEVLQGIDDQHEFEQVRSDLQRFPVLQAGGAALAIAAAENYRFLRAKGITVRKTIDCLIATFCMQHGHFLLHHDRDFDHFERHLGLKVIHP
jgi:predicted nucleic acid-binding protein